MSIPVTTLHFSFHRDASACMTHLRIVARRDNLTDYIKNLEARSGTLTVNYSTDDADYNAQIQAHAESFHAGVEYARRL